jgi:hypothetical protein
MKYTYSFNPHPVHANKPVLRQRFFARRGILAAVLVTGTATSVQAVTYSLNSDWSDTSNSNGVWTYRAGNTLMHQTAVNPHFIGSAWIGPDNYLPVLFKATAQYLDIHVGDVIVHSADQAGSGVANILWTAPAATTVDILGSAWFAADDGGQVARSSEWSLWLNGSLLSSGVVSWGDAYDRNNPFLFSLGSGGANSLQNLPVNTGDQIMLQIEKTPQSQYGTFVGLDLEIEAASTNGVPESGRTGLLFSLSVGMLVALRGRVRLPRHR